MLPGASLWLFHRATPSADGSESRLFEDRSRNNLTELKGGDGMIIPISAHPTQPLTPITHGT